ncbi:hypothetical protein QYF61_012201, partial [Mycteria americana]
MIMRLEHISREERLRELGMVSLKRRLRGDPINVCKYLMEGNEEGTRLFSVVPTGRTRGNGHKLKRSGQTLALVAQKGGGVYIHRDIQNPTGHSPGQPTLADWVNRFREALNSTEKEHGLLCCFCLTGQQTFVQAPNEQAQTNYNQSEHLCWALTAAQYPSQFGFALCSLLPEFHDGVIKTHFTEKLGKYYIAFGASPNRQQPVQSQRGFLPPQGAGMVEKPKQGNGAVPVENGQREGKADGRPLLWRGLSYAGTAHQSRRAREKRQGAESCPATSSVVALDRLVGLRSGGGYLSLDHFFHPVDCEAGCRNTGVDTSKWAGDVVWRLSYALSASCTPLCQGSYVLRLHSERCVQVPGDTTGDTTGNVLQEKQQRGSFEEHCFEGCKQVPWCVGNGWRCWCTRAGGDCLLLGQFGRVLTHTGEAARSIDWIHVKFLAELFYKFISTENFVIDVCIKKLWTQDGEALEQALEMAFQILFCLLNGEWIVSRVQ